MLSRKALKKAFLQRDVYFRGKQGKLNQLFSRKSCNPRVSSKF